MISQKVKWMCIPAKFHDFSVMLTNLKDSHDLSGSYFEKKKNHNSRNSKNNHDFRFLLVPIKTL